MAITFLRLSPKLLLSPPLSLASLLLLLVAAVRRPRGGKRQLLRLVPLFHVVFRLSLRRELCGTSASAAASTSASTASEAVFARNRAEK